MQKMKITIKYYNQHALSSILEGVQGEPTQPTDYKWTLHSVLRKFPPVVHRHDLLRKTWDIYRSIHILSRKDQFIQDTVL